ncbi:MAG: chloride channel protein, partial [Flavisolibacter sp.]|nr:chloride channel protein [Flavisolibacter sp.]
MKGMWQKIRQNAKFFFDLLASKRIKTNILQAIPFWIASLLTGLVAVGYTKLFSYTENILHAIVHWHQWVLFIITPLCFFLAWYVVRLFAPNAKGSGIPQVMAAIELATPKHHNKIDMLLGFRILLTKISSSLLMVMGGGAIG